MDKKWLINLKGKDYPLWGGVLNEAHEKGLVSITTELIQIPAEENGWMAVVKARATFEDGRVFEDYGDCSPKSTSPMLASAAIRLASTRAKGRCLRDAVNVGETMYDELAPEEKDERPAPPPPSRRSLEREHRASAPVAPPPQADREKTVQRYEAMRAEYLSYWPQNDATAPAVRTEMTTEAIQAIGRSIWPRILEARKEREEGQEGAEVAPPPVAHEPSMEQVRANPTKEDIWQKWQEMAAWADRFGLQYQKLTKNASPDRMTANADALGETCEEVAGNVALHQGLAKIAEESGLPLPAGFEMTYDRIGDPLELARIVREMAVWLEDARLEEERDPFVEEAA